jgi:two-component system, sensor histidine kinase and response regulator
VKYILIVDDNIKNLEMTARILKEEGYRISLAQDGESALKNMEAATPDLILLDVMMPGIDGFELCRKIKRMEQFKDVPVIFLSAKNQTEDLTDGFRSGGVDYITKPFRKEELLIRVKNHLELMESRKKIILMKKQRDRLYSIIAHDLRAPYASINLTIDAIANGYIDPCSDKFSTIINQLDKTVNETEDLLENLLAWTRLSSEVISVSPENCRLKDLTDKCVYLFERSLMNKKIDLDYQPGDDIISYCDESTVYAVIRNLISNAIKFTPEGGKIQVLLSEHKKYSVLTVKDSGLGMQPEILSRILSDNEPVTTPGTNNEKGSGLGFLLIRDFVNLNKGALDIESIPGEGTTITVSLPCEK